MFNSSWKLVAELAAIFLVSAHSLSGCSNSTTLDPGVIVKTGDGKYSIQTADGRTELSMGIPMYEGAVAVPGINAQGQKTLNLETSDSAENVWDFYKTGLSKDGWKLTVVEQFPGVGSITAQRDGTTCTALIIADTINAITTISLTLAEENRPPSAEFSGLPADRETSN